jgi:hypothetical protein
MMSSTTGRIALETITAFRKIGVAPPGNCLPIHHGPTTTKGGVHPLGIHNPIEMKKPGNFYAAMGRTHGAFNPIANGNGNRCGTQTEWIKAAAA